ncbi:DEKNAAC104594 [Brettanomyces naardenensis]|uniref:DEKNAAC104594 n=1 Tax=Brettanomyces naardenensis TaxID=13370 RepID=A0A448YRF3_BRENA|nr:DEKNAAC104594 [Brettanomyces naardenensis]
MSSSSVDRSPASTVSPGKQPRNSADSRNLDNHEAEGFDVTGDDPDLYIDVRSLTYTVKYDHLVCPICQQPFLNPYTTICGHTFCRACIMQAIRSPMGSKCPLDRTPLFYEERLERPQNSGHYSRHRSSSTSLERLEDSSSADDSPSRENEIFPAPIIISNITDDLKVRCMNNARGCEWVGPRWQIKLHLLKHCGYTRFVCGKTGIDGKICTKLCERRFMERKSEDDSEDGDGNEEADSDSGNDSTDYGCPHIEYPCPKCEQMVSQIDQEWHLKHECPKNMVVCHGCNFEFSMKLFETHEKYCEKIHVKCPGAKFGCSWRGSRDILKDVHLPECIFVKLSEYLEKQETRMDNLSHENSFLKSELSTILDSVIQGRLTNLGFPLDLEEVPRGGVTDSVLGSMEEDYAQLISDFEKLRLNAQRAKRALTELEVSKQMISGLAADNLQIKEEMSSQRLALNSIRQQLQFILMDRRRLNTTLTRLGSGTNLVNEDLPEPKLNNKL